MNGQFPTWVKPGIWGAVIGAIVVTIIGFSAGWVVTSGSAQQMANQQKEKAVIAALTPICVAQFKKQSEQGQTTKLAALENKDSWERGDYIEDQGWATLPGNPEPNDEVADACAEELMKLAAKTE